ncbi:hypothetical protein ATO7_10297 [Oceanococcus atlanticus]|uniref:Phospholipid-binding protein n=1 Tax=Oceanococcus atlanticus TaxID=1317117 RepID=A0A1Y1SEJ7_9GAMM|nr:YbhB/YbcL family Raf kinase inhibitor-like protein [Oceanococcus atlanticus]ORE87425.1 hypothetical protein ATO7_10297 [Oceanococcus atlanticus]
MQLNSNSLRHNQAIDGEFAFCTPHPTQHVQMAANRNPHLSWDDAPAGTQSYVVCCIDSDVPTKPDDVNQEGRSVPADLPRTEFVHWLVSDITPDITSIAAGSCCDGITPRGKTEPPGPAGSVQGVNDYTGWFAGDPDMEGTYLGYDGPCPPWNDSLVHHYHFTVYALDTPSLGLKPGFDLAALRQALEGHVLAEATLVGTYSLNPDVPA